MRSIVQVHEVLLKSAMFVVSWLENKCEKSTYLGFVSTNEPSNNPGEQSLLVYVDEARWTPSGPGSNTLLGHCCLGQYS